MTIEVLGLSLEVADVYRISAILGRDLLENQLSAAGFSGDEFDRRLVNLQLLLANDESPFNPPNETTLPLLMASALDELGANKEYAIPLRRLLTEERRATPFGAGKNAGQFILYSCFGLSLLVLSGKLHVTYSPETFKVEIAQDVPAGVERLLKQLVSIFPEIVRAFGRDLSLSTDPALPSDHDHGGNAAPTDHGRGPDDHDEPPASGAGVAAPPATAHPGAPAADAAAGEEPAAPVTAQPADGALVTAVAYHRRLDSLADLSLETRLDFAQALQARDQLVEVCRDPKNLLYIHQQGIRRKNPFRKGELAEEAGGPQYFVGIGVAPESRSGKIDPTRTLYRLAVRLYSKTRIKKEFLDRIEAYFKQYTHDLAQVRNLSLGRLLAGPGRWHGHTGDFGIGSQISGAKGPAGAITGFVRRNPASPGGDTGTLLAVAAGHVLSGHGAWPSPISIYSPSQGDTPNPTRHVGNVAEWRIFRRNCLSPGGTGPWFDPSLDLDAGLVMVNRNVTVENPRLVRDIGEISEIADAVRLCDAAGDNPIEVIKTAAGTPRTAGAITAVNVAVLIENDAKMLEARDLIEVVAKEGSMADHGDSGAPILVKTTGDSGRATYQLLGLVAAGSSWGTIFDPGGGRRPSGNGAAYVLPFKSVTDSFLVELA